MEGACFGTASAEATAVTPPAPPLSAEERCCCCCCCPYAQARIFGLCLCKLDIRQESVKHTEAIDAITTYLGLGSYKWVWAGVGGRRSGRSRRACASQPAPPRHLPIPCSSQPPSVPPVSLPGSGTRRRCMQLLALASAAPPPPPRASWWRTF